MPQNTFQATCTLIGSLLLFFVLESTIFRINILAPALVSLMYNLPLTLCLWACVACGFIQDAFVGSFRLGFIALSYALSLLIIYRWRFSFFRDSLVTLPLMTVFFSLFVSFLQFIELFFFDVQSNFSFTWLLNDFFIMPLLDGAYAFVVFALLPLFFKRFSRVHV